MARKRSQESAPAPVRGPELAEKMQREGYRRPEVGDTVTAFVRHRRGVRMEAVKVLADRTVGRPVLAPGEAVLAYAFSETVRAKLAEKYGAA